MYFGGLAKSLQTQLWRRNELKPEHLLKMVSGDAPLWKESFSVLEAL